MKIQNELYRLKDICEDDRCGRINNIKTRVNKLIDIVQSNSMKIKRNTLPSIAKVSSLPVCWTLILGNESQC